MLRQEDYKQHISERFNTELEEVKNHLLEMGGKVEQQLSAAISALVDGDAAEAEFSAFVLDNLARIETEDGHFAFGDRADGRDHLHRRCLAGAIGTEKPERLAGLDVEVDRVYGGEVAEFLGQAPCLD